jgi:hypothetical protein
MRLEVLIKWQLIFCFLIVAFLINCCYSFRILQTKLLFLKPISHIVPVSSNKNNIDPIRFFGFNAVALGLGVGANFLGCTSYVMSITNPQLFQTLELDQIYPINGFRRYINKEDHFQFVFPADWMIDPRVIAYNTRLQELPKPLQQAKVASSTIPAIAMGPSQSNFVENISVIKSKMSKQLNIFQNQEKFQSTEDLANELLSTFIAPPSSDRIYELLNAHQEVRNGFIIYQFEYRLQQQKSLKPTLSTSTLSSTVTSSNPSSPIVIGFDKHVVSVIGYRPETEDLLTFTATVPQDQWQTESSNLLTAAKSFIVK